jgi:hypothetical protein
MDRQSQSVEELARRDLSAARCLRSYADHYDRLHRDIADDFRLGAEALEARASHQQERDRD